MQGLFGLKTAADLREKLGHDPEVLKGDPGDTCAAFNSFVTAEQKPDWVYPETTPGWRKNRSGVRTRTSLPRLCGHLGNGARHFEVAPERHGSAESTIAWVRKHPCYCTSHAAGWFAGCGGHPLTNTLVIQLSEAEAADPEFRRPSIGAVGLAERIMRSWDEHSLA